jgi:hypothetical protein
MDSKRSADALKEFAEDLKFRIWSRRKFVDCRGSRASDRRFGAKRERASLLRACTVLRLARTAASKAEV